MNSLWCALTRRDFEAKADAGAWAWRSWPRLRSAFFWWSCSPRWGRRTNSDHWEGLVQNGHVLWSLLMLPLFITLQMGLLANVEHTNKAWKLLYAQPLPRWSVYAAKQLISLGLIALSMVVLVGVFFVSGKLVQAHQPVVRVLQAVPAGRRSALATAWRSWPRG